MSGEDLERAAIRLQTALRLYETGLAMKRAQIRRAYPAADDAEVRRRLVDWLHTRPGAPHGDAQGTPRVLPERAL